MAIFKLDFRLNVQFGRNVGSIMAKFQLDFRLRGGLGQSDMHAGQCVESLKLEIAILVV